MKRAFALLGLFLTFTACVSTLHLAADEPPAAKGPVDERTEPPSAVDAKTVDFLAGEWVSQDGSKNPLAFEKDGKFTCGFFQQKGKWVLAKGTWRIGKDGRVRAKASYNGSFLGLYYNIVGEELQAPMGPNPKVTWKKTPKAEAKKSG